jgi:hypothetical protein
MARSLASSTWIRTAVAVPGYVAFWAALVAVSAPAPEPRVNVGATVASHPVRAPAAWSVAHRVYDEVERRAHRLAPAQRIGVARAIIDEAARAAMDPLLVLAVIHVESRFDVRAVSEAGAVGLMQLLRPTMREEAARSGLGSADPFDPVANVRAGVRYLERMVDAFDDVQLALTAYNAGPARVRRHLREGGVPHRLLGYPRTVLRERARISADAAASSARPTACATQLAAAHARPPAAHGTARDGARVATGHGAGSTGTLPAGTLAAAVAPAPTRRASWLVPRSDDVGLPKPSRARSRGTRAAVQRGRAACA